MNNRCNLCNSTEFDIIAEKLRDEKDRFKVYVCLKCKHVQLFPKPTQEDDKEFYNKNLQDKRRKKEINYEKLRINNQYDTDRHIKLLKNLCPNTNCSILDIGSGYGFLGRELFNNGYTNVLCIEVSKERREIALERGSVQIINFDLNNPDREIGRFDIITLFHVLEHMSDPVLFLKNIRKFMNPTGILVCEVPNCHEMLLDYCRAYYDFYWIRAHLNYFHYDTLMLCFEKGGFEKIEIDFDQRYGLINLCNWLDTGKPQIESPIFEINEAYAPIENRYREFLKSNKKSDTIIACARID